MSRIGMIGVSKYFPAVAAALLLFSSCINDDQGDCYGQDSFLLYVKVVDTDTGEDITQSGGTEEVMLALFDARGRFIATRIMDAAEVRERKPWVITDLETERMQVSAWADIGEAVEQNDPAGAGVDGRFLSLSVDSEGYSPTPDDFFFGFLQTGTGTRAVRSGEVVVTQKNSKVNITVRGLSGADADDYYFVIEAPQDGYDFFGNPTTSVSRVRRTGEFNDLGELVSPLPYLTIHSPDPNNVGPENGAVVRLFRRSPSGDTEIATATRAADGRYIGLYSGKTTNILMELSGTGTLDVKIVVTGWREIHQWSQW